MSALVPFPSKALALIPRLGSDHDGERAATVRLIERQLRAAGMDWHDLVERLKAEPRDRIIYRDPPAPQRTADPRSWRDVAAWCRDHGAGRLNPKEAKFVREMAARLVFGGQPTERQAAWLRAIFGRLQGGAA